MDAFAEGSGKSETYKEALIDKIDRYRCGMMRNYAIKHADRSGIIYCRNVKQVNDCYKSFRRSDKLKDTVTRYYAGLDDDKYNRESGESKKKNWNQFLKNKKRIMITTTALGMGVDKDNVQYVLHAGMPSSLEDYYQEAGRAGRKEKFIKQGECILYYLPVVDRMHCVKLIGNSIEESGLDKEKKRPSEGYSV